MKKIVTAALGLVALAATSTAASAQFCVIPLMISAAIVASTEKRELTNTEAAFCGLVREQVPARKAAVTKKKVATTKKKQ